MSFVDQDHISKWGQITFSNHKVNSNRLVMTVVMRAGQMCENLKTSASDMNLFILCCVRFCFFIMLQMYARYMDESQCMISVVVFLNPV